MTCHKLTVEYCHNFAKCLFFFKSLLNQTIKISIFFNKFANNVFNFADIFSTGNIIVLFLIFLMITFRSNLEKGV